MRFAGLATAVAVQFAGATAASAHVKWFAAYDVAAPPVPLASVFSGQFMLVLLLTVVWIFVVFLCDRVLAANGIDTFIDDLCQPLRPHAPDILRVSLGVFFLCLWLLGGVLLTPELKTDSQAISWFQLLLAASTLFWRTTFIAGIGIFVLYAIALANYGLFHMMDYPLFLGIASFLVIRSLNLKPLMPHIYSILYASMAQTLLWASIEKWAYGIWTEPVLRANEQITLGIDHKTYIMLAGFVEFAFAFMILFGHTSQRVVAGLLLLIFVSAVGPFGKIDAVGHLMIITSLLVVIIVGNTDINRLFQNNIQSVVVGALELSLVFVASIQVYFLLYYMMHAAIFGKLALI